jgi:hypothetical protein
MTAGFLGGAGIGLAEADTCGLLQAHDSDESKNTSGS